MAFDVNGARQAGYSDAEILEFLNPKGFDLKGARDAGYSDKEILSHVTGEDTKPSGIVAGAEHGLSQVASGVGSTLKTFMGQDTPTLDVAATKAEPENYHSAQVLPEGSHWYDPRTYNYGAIPQAVAEAAPGMATDIAAAKVASKIPLVGKYAAVPAGIASYLLRTRGDAAKNDAVVRTGDQNAQPETQDKIRSLATGVAESIPQALGIGRFLPGGKIPQTVAQAGGKALMTGLTEAGAGGASNAISQAGATIGTPGGLKVDPNQVAESALTSGLVGGGLALPKMAGDALAVRKYAPFAGDNQAATEAVVKRVQDAADGGSLNNVNTAYNAMKTASGAVGDELKAAVKPHKDTLDIDTLDALKRAGKGNVLTDSDLSTIDQNTTPDVAHLARQAHVASLMKQQGDYGNGQFVGGVANAMAKHVRALQNTTGAVVSAGLGATVGGGHAASLFTYGPETLAAIGGSYMAMKALDKATGARSPMTSIAQRFQNPDAQTRMPAPAPAPQAPQATSGPTGPNVPFNPGVAGGNALLATGASPWINKPEPAAVAPTAPAIDPLALPAELVKKSKNLTGALRLVQEMKAKAEAKDQVDQVASDSPLVNDVGGLNAISNPQVGKLASAHVSAANALKKLMQQPEEAASETPAAQAPASGPPGNAQPTSMKDIIANLAAVTKAKAKISKKSGGDVKVEAPLAPEPEAPYETIPEDQLWRKGLNDQQVADKELSKYEPDVRKKYAKNVMAVRNLKRDTLEGLANDANDQDSTLMGHLYHRLDHVSRRGVARKEIDFWTAKMSPAGKQAVEAALGPLMSKMWAKE